MADAEELEKAHARAVHLVYDRRDSEASNQEQAAKIRKSQGAGNGPAFYNASDLAIGSSLDAFVDHNTSI